MQKMRKMKASGIEWIGEIPEGWEIKYFVQLFSQVKNKNIGLCEKNLLSLSYGKIKQKSIETVGGLLPDNFEGYNIIDRNDIVLRLTDLQNDQHSLRVGLSHERGIITSAYCSIRVRGAESPNYLYYYLHTFDIAKGFYGMGSGVRQGLNWDGLKYIKILLPPQHEQDRISVFLNQKTLEIDSMLSKTISSIEEYKKLKQAVITQAVTKTIYDDFGNPSKFRKLRSLCNVLSKGTTPKDIETQNDEFYCIRYLKSENIVSNQLNLNPTFFITAETNNSLERSKLNSGDILFVIAGASIGKVAITTADFLPANTNQAVAFIRLSSSYQYATKYIWYFLQSDVVKQLIALSAVQSAQPNLSLEDLGAMRLPLPDQMGCLKITDYLDAKCAEIDKLIAKKEQLVKELESYKKSLIYEVVTGKREV